MLAVYVTVGAGSAAIAYALGHDPLHAPSAWIGLTGASAALVSAGLGLLLAAATLAATRALLRRTAWARALHAALRPAVRHSGGAALLMLALASGAAEELLFRGLLAQLLGVIASSIAFGAVHQVKGAARWAWMGWATIMGLLFAVLFRATGSLVGPILAHAAINGVNLRLIRDHDPEPRHRPLGGLLKRASG
jgi:membrane protease YdiL (CAAX protease family)